MKNRFSRSRGHLGFPIVIIEVTFDLKVTLLLPFKFRISWSFGSGEAKNRFLRWPPFRTSWNSDLNDLRYFYQQVTPMLPTKFQVNWPFAQEKKRKIECQDSGHGGHL